MVWPLLYSTASTFNLVLHELIGLFTKYKGITALFIWNAKFHGTKRFSHIFAAHSSVCQNTFTNDIATLVSNKSQHQIQIILMLSANWFGFFSNPPGNTTWFCLDDVILIANAIQFFVTICWSLLSFYLSGVPHISAVPSCRKGSQLTAPALQFGWFSNPYPVLQEKHLCHHPSHFCSVLLQSWLPPRSKKISVQFFLNFCLTTFIFSLCLSHFCSALLQRGSQLTAPALRLADLLSHHSQTLVKVEPTNFRSKSHWMAFRETGLDPLFSTPFLNLLMIGWFLWCFCQ